jgi:heterodisulfide reductase subunit B2
MKLSYYPGCSLESTAIEYKKSLETVAHELNIELAELPDWTCCGSSSAHVTNDQLAVSLAGRNLLIADKIGLDLLVPCSACFQRLKSADRELKAGKSVAGMAQPYTGKFSIKHAPDLIWETIGEKGLAGKVEKPLSGLKPVCYYGCLTSRPPKVTGALDPENPTSMDEILRIMGADVKNWSYKTDCCGGNLMLTHPDLAKNLVKKLFDNALEAEADCIVVACPMCQSNLDTRQREIQQENGQNYNLPVYYFTELMEVAFGCAGVENNLNKHFTEAITLLRQKGLLGK